MNVTTGFLWSIKKYYQGSLVGYAYKVSQFQDMYLIWNFRTRSFSENLSLGFEKVKWSVY